MLNKKSTPFWIVFFIIACKSGGLSLNIQYDQINGLKKGDAVFYKENRIGDVERVAYTDGGVFNVQLAIQKEFEKLATEHTRFFIIKDHNDPENMAIELILSQKGGQPLKDGATLVGSTRPSVPFTQVWGDLEKGLENVKTHFDRLLDDMRSIPESEEFKKLENELKRLLAELQRSSHSVREKMKKEILPRLKEEMENLREKLEKFGRQEEMKPLENEMEEIQKI
jgi:paraquat-inducible protein B